MLSEELDSMWPRVEELLRSGRASEALLALQFLASSERLEHRERARAALLAADVALLLGRLGLAATYLTAAEELGLTGPQRTLHGLLRAELLLRSGRVHEAAVQLRRLGEPQTPDWFRPGGRVRKFLLEAELELQFGNFIRAEELAARAAAEPEADDSARVRAMLLRAVAHWRSQDLDSAWILLRDAVEMAETAGDAYLLGRACLLAGRFLGETGYEGEGVPDAASLLARAHTQFRATGSLRDMDEVRMAFRAHGRRLSDRLRDEPIMVRAEDVSSALRELAGLAEHLSSSLAVGDWDVDRARKAVFSFLSDFEAALMRSDRALEGLLEAAGEAVVRQKRLTQLFQALRQISGPLEPAAFTQAVVELTARLLGARRVVLALVSRNGELASHAEYGQGGDEWRGLAEQALRQGVTRRTEVESGLRSPVGHALAVPLWTGSKAVGVLVAAQPETGGVFSASDESLLELLGIQVAAILEHHRYRWALKVAARTREVILDSISDGVLLVDPDGTVRYANETAAKLLGRRAGELEGLAIERLLGPLRRLGHDWKALDGQVIRLPGGESLVSAQVIRDDQGGEAGVVLSLAEMRQAKRTAQRLVGATARYRFEDILTRNPEMLECIELAKAAAATDANVLIVGESGTGKEVFAQAIHNASVRASGPFVGINCAAIPRELLESELFGYEEGAFTGARRGGRPGKFEVAEGGTILLDEIGDMPLEMQAKLLRVLQERRFRRVGGTHEIPLNAHIIATTNRQLEELVETGAFRQDLLYRLKVIEIRLPPLRERPEDVPLLARHFLRVSAQRFGKNLADIAPEVMQVLENYPWPGNVRELQHVMESAVSLAPPDETVLRTVPGALTRQRASTLVGLPTVRGRRRRPSMNLVEVEKELLVAAMRQYRGSIPDVARELGVSRGTVYNKLRKYGLDPAAFRTKE